MPEPQVRPTAAGADAGADAGVDARGRRLWAPQAWLPGGWAEQVLLGVGADGTWTDVTTGVANVPPDAQRLGAPVLPGLVDAHSHAFQRAFAGLAERRESAADDFWSWRDRMYRVALRITPAQLRAIAAQLQVELLLGGYTQLCEFHYLQHAEDGRPYADPLELGWAIAEAAADTGIGLTLMPALYERAGFAQPTLREDQRRFRLTADEVWQRAQAIAAARRPNVSAGLVVHSLRAAAPRSLHRLRALAEHFDGPIHIHVSEQTAEVDECLATTGCRPIEWLAREGLLDARWQLVHATHTVPAEIEAVARAGAGMVICPSTEANLGDGLADVPGWHAAGVPLAIGSDSHVTRDWREELRWLDYGQRLVRRQRNVSAEPPSRPSTAARLWTDALDAGARAAGFGRWGLVKGARADLLLADAQDPALLGVPAAQMLDAAVFSSPSRAWEGVMVAGRWVAMGGRHPESEGVARRFEDAMRALWRDA